MRKNIGNDFAVRGFVTCGDCGTPLHSSRARGRGQSYVYYRCQSHTCASYGKSVPRDRLDGDIGAPIKTLQPSPSLFAPVKTMFGEA